MKINDLVELQYDFEIDSYEENTRAFEISIRLPNEKMHWVIPIYIGGFGIYPPGNNFVVPGDYLPTSHPDYFKVLDANKLIVELKGAAYNVILGKQFQEEGIYRLEPLSKELFPIVRKAEEYSEEKRNEICYNMVGSRINAEFIRGTAVRLYTNKAGISVKYFQSFPNMLTASTKDKYVVIHDEDTNIEYPVPYDCLKVKT